MILVLYGSNLCALGFVVSNISIKSLLSFSFSKIVFIFSVNDLKKRKDVLYYQFSAKRRKVPDESFDFHLTNHGSSVIHEQ